MQPRDTDASAPDPLIGQTLAGQFEIVKRLGSGGMGAVYLAEQSDMGRQVVIKVMHPELTVGNPQAVERFKREARAVAALNHPHIVQVYVFGQADDGRMYLAMEYIEGRDLASEIGRGALSQGRALKILDQAAAALVEAHSRGIVHRDLKPENVMLADRHGNPDWVKVLDFGIAKVHAAHAGDGGMEAAALTQQGAIFGTPRYMAPEQITGQPIDARTDLYALGIIFHEMLTGEHPFRANTALDYLVKHVQEEVVLPSVSRPGLGVHPRVEQILQRLVAKDPAARFQSAAELQREVRVAMGVAGVALTHTLSVSADAIVEAVQQAERAATVTAAREAVGEAKPRRGLMWALVGVVVVGGGVAAVLAISGSKGAGSGEVGPVVARVADGDTGGATGGPAASDVGATGGAVGAGASDAGATVGAGASDAGAVADVVTALAAGKPIEGFPVPDGTRLVSATPTELRLESSASARAILAFYEGELAGRVKGMPNGLEFTDPTSPWMSLVLWPEGDRVSILVGRRAREVDQATADAQVADGGEGPDDAGEVAVADAGPDGASSAAVTPKKAPSTTTSAANKTIATNKTSAGSATAGGASATPATTPAGTPGTGSGETAEAAPLAPTPVVANPDLIARPNRLRNPARLRPGTIDQPARPLRPGRLNPKR